MKRVSRSHLLNLASKIDSCVDVTDLSSYGIRNIIALHGPFHADLLAFDFYGQVSAVLFRSDKSMIYFLCRERNENYFAFDIMIC